MHVSFVGAGAHWSPYTLYPIPYPLYPRRRTLVTDAAKELEKCKMARFDERSGNLYVTDLGRVASHFYIRHVSIVTFNEELTRHMDEAKACSYLYHQ